MILKEFQCIGVKGGHSRWMKDRGAGMNRMCLHGAEFSLAVVREHEQNGPAVYFFSLGP